MPPKKKGNKKAQDDWEADLGETIPSTHETAVDANDAAPEAKGDDDTAGGGGLMAMLRKNKERRKKKGLADDDLIQEEDAPSSEPLGDISNKAPQEATLDDEFALPEKKGKGGKAKPAARKDDAADGDDAGSGRVLTKAEKEKLKKEREKQRKKEQVCCSFPGDPWCLRVFNEILPIWGPFILLTRNALLELRPRRRRHQSQPKPQRRPKQRLLRMLNRSPLPPPQNLPQKSEARRRSCQLTLL